jgi:hypothetical protein
MSCQFDIESLGGQYVFAFPIILVCIAVVLMIVLVVITIHQGRQLPRPNDDKHTTEANSPVYTLDPTNHQAVAAVQVAFEHNRAAMRARGPWQPPETRNAFEELYIVFLLEDLLQQGRVVVWRKSRALEATLGNYNSTEFRLACDVVARIPGVQTTSVASQA